MLNENNRQRLLWAAVQHGKLCKAVVFWISNRSDRRGGQCLPLQGPRARARARDNFVTVKSNFVHAGVRVDIGQTDRHDILEKF